jgi:hypothetical protein
VPFDDVKGDDDDDDDEHEYDSDNGTFASTNTDDTLLVTISTGIERNTGFYMKQEHVH